MIFFWSRGRPESVAVYLITKKELQYEEAD